MKDANSIVCEVVDQEFCEPCRERVKDPECPFKGGCAEKRQVLRVARKAAAKVLAHMASIKVVFPGEE